MNHCLAQDHLVLNDSVNSQNCVAGKETTAAMAESNSTFQGYPRSSSSPELWVPYVMIGLSCVTFLAVHFWCYHKRNRERYLRKRDEKRVKSGLLERRRITTLMLARYQSDLGISQSETDIDHSQDCLFYDNAADVTLDETQSDIYQEGHKVKDISDSVSLSKVGSTQEMMATSAAAAKSHVSTHRSASATGNPCSSLPNSQTWPLARERRSIDYSVHPGDKKIGELDGGRTGERGWAGTDTGNCQTSLKHLSEHKPDYVPLTPTEYGDRAGHGLTTTPNTSLFQTEFRDVGSSSTPLPKSSSSSSPPGYQQVFYTQLQPPYSTPSPVVSTFKAHHKKRRHDGVPVDVADHPVWTGQRDTSSSIDCGQVSSRCDVTRNSTKPYTISDGPREGGDYYVSNNNNRSSVYPYPPYPPHSPTALHPPHPVNDMCLRGVTEDESFPFAETGLEYGSINSNLVNQNVQMIPLRDIKYTRPGQDRRPPGHDGIIEYNGLDQIPRGHFYFLQHENPHGIESTTDIDAEEVSSKHRDPFPPRYPTTQHNDVSPTHNMFMSHRPRLKLIRKSQGKFPQPLPETMDNVSNSYPTHQGPAPLCRQETLDNSECHPNVDTFKAEEPEIHLDLEKFRSIHPHKTSTGIDPNTPDNPTQTNDYSPEDYTAQSTHGIAHTADTVRPAHDGDHTSTAIDPSKPTPNLRDLNPKLIFQYCSKRKLGNETSP